MISHYLDIEQHVIGTLKVTKISILQQLKSISFQKTSTTGFQSLMLKSTMLVYVRTMVHSVAMTIQIRTNPRSAISINDQLLLISSLDLLIKSLQVISELGRLEPNYYIDRLHQFLCKIGCSGGGLITQPASTNIMYKYLVFASIYKIVNSNIGFKDVANATPILSHLQYWIRTTVTMDIAKNFWAPDQLYLTHEKIQHKLSYVHTSIIRFVVLVN